jgi:hypothetical protein
MTSLMQEPVEELINTLNSGSTNQYALIYKGVMDVSRLDRILGMLVVIRNAFADDERTEI